MAKVVIAGSADCLYYAKVELLADNLARNLPNFKLHKIVVQPDQWKSWLSHLCEERNWSHNSSPIIWRELVDRGGKGIIIGGANEFQEYAYAYYDIKSILTSKDLKTIAGENKLTKLETDKEECEVKQERQPVKVCITNGEGDVCYHLAKSFANGDILGPCIDVDLALYEHPPSGSESETQLYEVEHDDTVLDGVAMELTDLAYPLLTTVTPTACAEAAFAGCCTIVLLDEVEQQEDEPKEDWLKRVHARFVGYARVIDEVSPRDVKVIVAGRGPINFIVSMMIANAPHIRRQNIVGCSQLIECQAKGVLADTLALNPAGIVDVTVWGNINGSFYVDMTRAKLHGFDGAVWGPNWFSVSAHETTRNDKWLEGEYQEKVKARHTATMALTGHSQATIAAVAALTTTLKYWWNGSPAEQTFSLAVQSEGWFDVPEGLVFSYPVKFTSKGYWTVCQDIDISDETKAKLQNIVRELMDEREAIYPGPKKESDPTIKTPSIDESEKAATEGGEENDDKFNLGKIEEDREGEEQAHTDTGEEDGNGVPEEGEGEPVGEVGEQKEEQKEEQQEQDASGDV